ncbi:MAG: glycosyltransferase family 2 protein [Lentisphaeria bacterium]|nr:glycosyltransferase family 2 protein [Lentisphaeria bacterium]
MIAVQQNGRIPVLCPEKSKGKRVCAVIPVYNNGSTVRPVAEKTLRYISNLLILDDGSTDIDLKAILADLPLVYCRQEPNLGKGAALRRALRLLADSGFDYMLTLDADGQHDPADIPAFLKLAENRGNLLVIGCRDFTGQPVPSGSRLGRKISNLLLKLECGIPTADSQSGFRMYPVRILADLPFRCSRFDFETEVLAMAAQAGADFLDIPVKVHYPPMRDRITHFRPLPELTRLTRLHFQLLTKRLSRKKRHSERILRREKK